MDSLTETDKAVVARVILALELVLALRKVWVLALGISVKMELELKVTRLVLGFAAHH